MQQFKQSALELINSKKWELASTHLSAMNIRLIENLASGKLTQPSDIMLEYIPHALEQARQAVQKSKR